MIFESAVLAGPWLYSFNGIEAFDFLMQPRSILCHLVWETESALGCREHASTRSITRHIGPDI